DLIAPVPLHPRRLWLRRFNQSVLLADRIGRHSGIAVEPMVLRRIRRTRQQVGLSRREREANVRGAFRVLTAEKPIIAGRRVLLVDDVFTSGATARAASRALLRGGAEAVDVLTFARIVNCRFWRRALDFGNRWLISLAERKFTDYPMADVTIYTRNLCGYCVAAKRLLADKGAVFNEIDATFSPQKRDEMMARSGRLTFPQIFIGEMHVGGYMELRTLENAGKLDPILAG
ncbi:MAG TPA: glutaredoxin 3, partial [Afifellaceae bacterium]|nr:glutaredoxin 3 [Afifellaceae bacterium]